MTLCMQKEVHFLESGYKQDNCWLVTGCNEVVAKVMFLLVCVILFTGGSALVHAGISPGRRPSPRKEVPPGTPQKQTPGKEPPWRETPRKEASREGAPPPSIRSMSGRYASYWNVFLFRVNLFIDLGLP